MSSKKKLVDQNLNDQLRKLYKIIINLPENSNFLENRKFCANEFLKIFSNIKFIKIMNKEKSIGNEFFNFNDKAEEQDMVAAFFLKIPRIFLELFAVLIIMVIFQFLVIC